MLYFYLQCSDIAANCCKSRKLIVAFFDSFKTHWISVGWNYEDFFITWFFVFGVCLWCYLLTKCFTLSSLNTGTKQECLLKINTRDRVLLYEKNDSSVSNYCRHNRQGKERQHQHHSAIKIVVDIVIDIQDVFICRFFQQPKSSHISYQSHYFWMDEWYIVHRSKVLLCAVSTKFENLTWHTQCTHT